MTLSEKATANVDDLCSTPGTSMVEGEAESSKLLSDFHMSALAPGCTHRNKIKIRKDFWENVK